MLSIGSHTRSVRLLLVGFFLALFIVGCEGEPEPKLNLIFVVDLSASIEPRAEKDAFNAIQRAVEQMKRGSRLTVIPVAADAPNDDQGRILRWQLPEKREPFDGDLHRIASEAAGSLRSLLQQTLASPYPKTDLLGAVDLAGEELAQVRPTARKVVVLLSDFIQNDSRLDFDTDPRLGRESSASELASSMAKGSGFAGTSVYLGSLASLDLRQLDWDRRQAIRAFWVTLFANRGAAVRWSSDGPGQLEEFLAELAENQTLAPTPRHLTGKEPSGGRVD